MVVVLCSVCGEPSLTDEASCRVCDSDDHRAVPGPVADATSEERLLESVEQTLHSLDRLQTTREEQHAPASRRQRALRVRLESQRFELATRIRGDHAHTNGGYREVLGRVKRELDRSL